MGVAVDTDSSLSCGGLVPMDRVSTIALIAAASVAFPAIAQSPPPAQSTLAAPKPAGGPPAAAAGPNAPVTLQERFPGIDTAHKGEVTRAEFLKYRLKTFEKLDTNHDGKLSLEQFLKVAEPPFSEDVPNGPSTEQRKARARSDFADLDTNRDGFVERAEVEAVVQAEFDQYDTDRDDKVTEAELRLVMQQATDRFEASRQKEEARRRQGLVTIGEFIDLQLREADRIDKNGDGKVSLDEYVAALAGPADGPQAQNMPPYALRKQFTTRRFNEIDTNKDGFIDRGEFTGHVVRLFIEIDTNKDRLLDEAEFKKWQEVEGARIRAFIQAQTPTQTPAQRPAPPGRPQGQQ
jgi:Ca2+-binding EF-hand superfamily protein